MLSQQRLSAYCVSSHLWYAKTHARSAVSCLRHIYISQRWRQYVQEHTEFNENLRESSSSIVRSDEEKGYCCPGLTCRGL